jgi:hypothetical protein
VLPIDADTKRDPSSAKDDYDSRTMVVNEKIIVDEEGVWVSAKGDSKEDYIKLLTTKKFIDINCPKIFQKTS